jgi:histone H3
VVTNEIHTENTEETDVVVIATKKAKRRFKKGTVALRQIREYQKSTDLLLPKASFRRIVNDMVKEVAPEINIRFSKKSIDAIQEACETHVTNTL